MKPSHQSCWRLKTGILSISRQTRNSSRIQKSFSSFSTAKANSYWSGTSCIENVEDNSIILQDEPSHNGHVRSGSKLEQLTLRKSGPLYPSKPDLDVAQEHF